MRSIFKLAILVIVLSPMLGFAQGVRYPNTVFATGGFPNAQVTVCTEPATDIAGGGCTPLATVYQDPGLAVPYAQPFSTDANGNFSFYAPPSTVGVPSTQYHAQISGLGLITYDIPYIFIPGGGGGSGGGISGSGTTGFIPEWTSGSSIGNSPIRDAGNNGILIEELTQAAAGCGVGGLYCAGMQLNTLIPINGFLGSGFVSTLSPQTGSTSAHTLSGGVFSAHWYVGGGSGNVVNDVEGLVGSTNSPPFGGGAANDTVTFQAGVVGLGVGIDELVTTNAGLYVVTNGISPSVTITNNAGIYVDSPGANKIAWQNVTQSGVFTHNYGIYIADQTTVGGSGSNADPWGIYEVAGKNYLGGQLTLGNITGATQCLQVNSAGLIGGTGSACGSGGGGGGNVSGPGSSISGDIALWNNTTGTLLSDAFFGFPLANAHLANSTIGIAGTSNQITSSTATPALGGSTTLAIANPFIFPGKATGAASTTSAATFNIPTGSAPSAPASGDFWNLSGILQFYDGTHANSLATVQTAPTSGHCAEFSGTAGLLIDAGAACGSGSGSSALSSITAATTTNSINSGNNAQTWNWSLTGATTVGMTFTENSASTGGTPGVQALIGISPLAGSTAVPLILANSLTGSQALPTLSIAPTWNTTGVVDAALLINATNTASGTGSLLADLQINGVSQWSTDKTGTTTQKGSIKIVNDGVHASQVQLVGNTTLWPLGSNEFSLSGPNVASFTSWGIQMPSVGPSVASVLGVGALSSQWSQASLIAIQGTDAKLLSSGTISGSAGIGLCTDANGGATTSGCSPAISLPWSGLTNPTTNLSLSMGINTTLWTVGDYGASPSTAFGITDTATSSTDTTTNFAVNTGTSSRHGSVLFQSSSVNVFQILSTASGAGNWQSISGNCASTPAVTGDYAMMIGCTQAAAPVVDRVFANSAAFTGVVVQAQTETASGSGFKLFDGRVGCSANGTCASGIDEFYVLGNGTIFSNALTLGQSFSAGAGGLVSSTPVFDAANMSGATGEFAHDLSNCLTAIGALPNIAGICNMEAETGAVSTAATVSSSVGNVTIWMPQRTISLGSGFDLNFTGTHVHLICRVLHACTLNASAAATTNAVAMSGAGSSVEQMHYTGGRCGNTPCNASAGSSPNTENAFTFTGAEDKSILNWVEDAGHIGINFNNCVECLSKNDLVDRAGTDGIYVNTSNATAPFSTDVKIIGSIVRDSEVTGGTGGQIGVASSGGSGNTDGTLIDDVTVRDLVFGATIATNNLENTDTGNKQGIQSTDGVNHTIISNSHVFNTNNEGFVNGGIGFETVNDTCDACGLVGSGAGAFLTSFGGANLGLGDGLIANDIATNSSGTQLGYCAAIQDEVATGTNLYQNITVAHVDCNGGLAGMVAGIRWNRGASDTLTLSNVQFKDISVLNATTPVSVTYGGSGSVTGAVYFFNINGLPAPSCGSVTGSGSGATCTVDTGSSNDRGIIILTTGTGSPTGAGTATLTFSLSRYGADNPACQYSANNGGAGKWNGLAVMQDTTPSNTTDVFAWTNGTTPTALSASTAYWITYQCQPK